MHLQDRERTTHLLSRAREGDEAASGPLLEAVYGNLRALAGSYLDGAAASHTLQPTALVHEAYMRLVDRSRATIADETHFLALAATVMRQILVDNARAKRAAKRGGDRRRVTLSGLRADEGQGEEVDLVDLDAALERLRERSERQARVVELRFFGGLTVAQCAGLLDVSERTVEADWRMSRAWLHAVLVKGASI